MLKIFVDVVHIELDYKLTGEVLLYSKDGSEISVLVKTPTQRRTLWFSTKNGKQLTDEIESKWKLDIKVKATANHQLSEKSALPVETVKKKKARKAKLGCIGADGEEYYSLADAKKSLLSAFKPDPV